MDNVNAIIVTQYGDAELLEKTFIDLPELNDNELLIKVKSAGVSPFDLHVRDGWYKDVIPYKQPIILRWEIAGDIIAIGKAVSNFHQGDAVLAHPNVYHNGGGYAEYVIVQAAHAAHKPLTVTYEEAAAISMNGLTAWQALFTKANLQKGQCILIHAAAGGVGHIAVQLAKWAGAYVIATASEKNREYLQSLGIDEFIDYQRQDIKTTLETKVDVVFDLIGSKTLLDSFHLVKTGGIVVTIVDFENIKKAADFNIQGETVVVEPNQQQLTKLVELAEKKVIKVNIAQIFPLDQAKAAQQLLETQHVRGKLILNPWQLN